MAFIPFIIPPQTCQSCRAVLTLGTRRCPSCGTEVARLSVLPLWAVIGLGLLTLGLVAFLAFGETMPSTPTIMVAVVLLGLVVAGIALSTRRE